MLFILCLIVSCHGDGDARRLVPTSRYRWGSEDDLIRSLSSSDQLEESRNSKRMLEDNNDDKLKKLLNSGDSSRIRSLIELYRNKQNEASRENKRQLPRRGRQELRQAKQIQEGCEATGYETIIREECTKQIENVCSNVTIMNTRPDIERKCTTRIDQKCRPTKTDIPQQQCTPRYEKRCETHYQTIDEKSYNEECEEEIKHVCKEHITVPVEVPYPVETPNHGYGPDHKEEINQHYIPATPTPYPTQPKSYEATPHPKLSHYESPSPYLYPKDPTHPTSQPYHKEHAYHTPNPQNTQPMHLPSYLHHEQPTHPTSTPQQLFHHPHHEPQGVTISPHGTVHHHSPTPHFKRQKRESEAAAESEPEAEGEAKADSNSQFGNLIYGDLFRRIIKKSCEDRIAGRQSQISRTKGPKILRGVVNLSPHTESIQGENRERQRTGRLRLSDINGLKGSLRNQQNKLVFDENVSKEFSNLQLVNGEHKTVLGSPITQAPSLLHQNSQFSNILSSDSQGFNSFDDNLKEITLSPLGNRFRSSAPGILSDTSQERTLAEQVKQAMFDVLEDVPELGGAFDGFQFDTEDNIAITQIKSGKIPGEKIVHATIEHDPHGQFHLGEHFNLHQDGHPQHQLHPDVHLHHKPRNLHHPNDPHHYDPPVHDPHHHDLPQVQPDGHLSKPVPTVTIVELPAESGCRTFSTKSCLKVPIVVPKKVPYEECREVPAVDCFFVLKTVDDIECSPTSVEDCTAKAIEVPYFDQEEICEDIEFDDCVDVEVQEPIQVCKSVDPDRKPIFNREIEGTSKRKGGKRTGTVSRPASQRRPRY